MSVHDEDDSEIPAKGETPSASAGGASGKALPIRPELRNWRVIDVDEAQSEKPSGLAAKHQSAEPADETIEGEAVVLDEAAEHAMGLAPSPGASVAPDEGIIIDEAMASVGGGSAPAHGRGADTEDRVDSILIAGLPDPVLILEPGAQATLVVSLLNNGAQPAVFDISIEGWMRESWLPPGGVHVPVLPGERVAATIAITAPRHPTTTAGEFPFHVVVRSPQHLRRTTRLRGTLIIRPFTDFTIGRLAPPSAALYPLRRRSLFTFALSNQSNHPLALQVKGQGVGLDVDFDFNDDPAQPWQPSPAVVELAPGAGMELFVRAQVRSGPLFATRPVPAAIRVVGSVIDELRPPRSASAEVIYHSLIRPWHLGLAIAASLLLLVASGTMAIAARFLLDTSVRGPTAGDVAVNTPAPVVIVLNQAAPQGGSTSPPPGAQQPPAAQGALTVDGLPVVRADQVTAPGQPAPGQPAPGQPAPGQSAPVAQTGASSQRTYAQMFQEIALLYDLDWRLLAAQAYQESGFDPLALGNDGDMGLMQVLPATWREWAPRVGASDPFDAWNNTLVAAAYLDHVRALMGQRGKPQAQWMLVAYNWGPDKLGDFLDGGGAWDDLPPERARYATEIMSVARTIP